MDQLNPGRFRGDIQISGRVKRNQFSTSQPADTHRCPGVKSELSFQTQRQRWPLLSGPLADCRSEAWKNRNPRGLALPLRALTQKKTSLYQRLERGQDGIPLSPILEAKLPWEFGLQTGIRAPAFIFQPTGEGEKCFLWKSVTAEGWGQRGVRQAEAGESHHWISDHPWPAGHRECNSWMV